MPDAWWSLGKEIKNYLEVLREAGRSEKMTIGPYNWSLNRMFGILKDNGYPINPRAIGKKELVFLRDVGLDGSNRYKSNQIGILMGFLKHAGNKEVVKLKISFGNTSPTKIRWLEDKQAAKVKAMASGMTKMLIHCEMELGMRRIEVLRLKVSDFLPGLRWKVNLLGKGRNGGKPRQIACHRHTPEVFEEFLALRNEEVRKARAKNPDVDVPEDLFIYERKGELHPYKKTAIDNMLARLGEEVGFEFSNHDLRRTCGRMLHRAGVKIEEIARIFGHSDTRMTVRYLGLDTDDMGAALDKLAEYQAQNHFLNQEKFLISQ